MKYINKIINSEVGIKISIANNIINERFIIIYNSSVF